MLRHEIVSTLWANELVDFGSALLIPRLQMEFSLPVVDICQTHTMACRTLQLPRLRKGLMALDSQLPAHVQYEAFAALEDAAATATHWLLSTFAGDSLQGVLAKEQQIQTWAQGLDGKLAEAQTSKRKAESIARAATWVQAGMPEDLAKEIATIGAQAHLFTVWQLTQEAATPTQTAVTLYFATAEVTGLAELLAQVGDAAATTRWEAAALSSLGQGLGYTLFRLAARVAQSIGTDRPPTLDAVRAVLVDELKLGPLWELANQIQAEGVQIPALVVLTEKLRTRLR
jgi:glutamate dehydrogenase